MKPKQLKIGQTEIVSSLDATLSIWRSAYGFYWLDQFDGSISEVFFDTAIEAMKDCEALVMYQNEAEIGEYRH